MAGFKMDTRKSNIVTPLYLMKQNKREKDAVAFLYTGYEFDVQVIRVYIIEFDFHHDF